MHALNILTYILY